MDEYDSEKLSNPDYVLAYGKLCHKSNVFMSKSSDVLELGNIRHKIVPRFKKLISLLS